MRRCSIKARATGLTKMRCGSCNSVASLRPSLPASSRATSVIATLAPAQGWLGEIARGLRRAAAGARLRQRERKFRRFEQRTHRRAGRRVVVLEREIGMRFDHAVVVVHLVVEPQRTARLPLRILDQRDGRRAVGDGGERPGEIAAADAVQHRRAVALDQEAALLAARRQSCVRRACARIRRRILETALAHHVEAHIAGRADHQLAAGRHRDRRRRACAVSPGRKPGSMTGGRPV